MAKRLEEVFKKKMEEAFSNTAPGAESDESSSDFGDSDSDDEKTRKLQAIQKKVRSTSSYYYFLLSVYELSCVFNIADILVLLKRAASGY